MANTTNFGWETPDDTDLVKDGAAAMRTLGNSIDTSFVDLKGGTTGQILSKNSNTDLDFTWIANDQGDITAVTAGTGISGGGTSGAVTITNDMATTITAAGDIVVGTGSGTYDNLPIGTTGQVLTADTTVSPYKVKWDTPTSGAWTEIATGSFTSSTTISSISGTYRNLQLVIKNVSGTSASAFRMRLNSDTGTNYVTKASSASGDGITYDESNAILGVTHTTGDNLIIVDIPDYANATTPKLINALSITQKNATPTYNLEQYRSAWNGTAAINAISFLYGSGSFDGGTYTLYGVK